MRNATAKSAGSIGVLRWGFVLVICAELLLVAANAYWEGRLRVGRHTWLMALPPGPMWSAPSTPVYDDFAAHFRVVDNFPPRDAPDLSITRVLDVQRTSLLLLFYLWPTTWLTGLLYLAIRGPRRDRILHISLFAAIGLTCGAFICCGMWLLLGGWGPPAPVIFGFMGILSGVLAGMLTYRPQTSRQQEPVDYSNHVEHPRFGREPRYTGLDPDRADPDVHIHWNTRRVVGSFFAWHEDAVQDDVKVIWGTAIAAREARQCGGMTLVTHYYDLDRRCRRCGRRFIFYAEEQQYWYEELKFDLGAEAVCCVPCRKSLRAEKRRRRRYGELSQIEARTPEQNLELADCCLQLMEAGEFHPRHTQRVRMLLNRLPEPLRQSDACSSIRQRLVDLEQRLARGESPYRDRSRERGVRFIPRQWADASDENAS